jgi:hypothetical protein
MDPGGCARVSETTVAGHRWIRASLRESKLELKLGQQAAGTEDDSYERLIISFGIRSECLAYPLIHFFLHLHYYKESKTTYKPRQMHLYIVIHIVNLSHC